MPDHAEQAREIVNGWHGIIQIPAAINRDIIINDIAAALAAVERDTAAAAKDGPRDAVIEAVREWRNARLALSNEHPRTLQTNRRVTTAQQTLDHALAALDAADTQARTSDAAGLAQQLIDGANREGVDTYTKTLLWHASSVIDRLSTDTQARGGWRPIESAPRQRQILLWAVTSVDPPNWRMETGHCLINFDGESEWTWGGRRLESYDTKPTHWQPLPPPPLPEPAPREGEP